MTTRSSSAISTVLAPDCLRTISARAELPLSEEAERASSMSSTTVATSRIRTAAPPSPVMTSASISATEWTSPRVVTVSSRLPWVTWPAGMSRLCARRVSTTSPTASP